MAKGTFVFYKSILESIEVLTENRVDIDAAMGAVVRYGVRGEEYNGDNAIVKCALLQAKPLIDADKAKTHRNGAPKGNINASKMKPKNNDSLNQNKHSLKKNNDTLKKNNDTPIIDVDVDVDKDVDKNINLTIKDAMSKQSFDAAAIQSYYNEQIQIKKARLRKSAALTDNRKGFIMARLSEYGEEKVKQVVDKAMDSRFLNYEASNAPVDLEWIMRPNNFLKILEGKYDNSQGGTFIKDVIYPKIVNNHFEGEFNPDIYKDEDKNWRKL